jgi:hypothetical protein
MLRSFLTSGFESGIERHAAINEERGQRDEDGFVYHAQFVAMAAESLHSL